MEVNILGETYKIVTHKVSEDEVLKRNSWSGYCSHEIKKIIIADTSEEKYFSFGGDKKSENIYRNSIIRHEIIHGFLEESGLGDSTNNTQNGWATNEEMVDWIALQFPKILKAFEEAGCI